MLYAIEAWYPSQYVLQNSIERIKKFAAKLCANDFTASYPQLLEKLNWKPVSQLVMEKRALAMHHFTRGHRNLPDNAIALCRQEDRRRTGRTGHEWELVIPVTSLEAVRSSSLNTARQTWTICQTTSSKYPTQCALRTLWNLLPSTTVSPAKEVSELSSPSNLIQVIH